MVSNLTGTNIAEKILEFSRLSMQFGGKIKRIRSEKHRHFNKTQSVNAGIGLSLCFLKKKTHMYTAQSALLTTAYCPPVVYLAQFQRFHTIYLEQWENYQKGSYRNRTYIATGNGILALSVPLLKGKHQRMPVREVQIDQRQSWLKIHLDSLRSAYNNAPYFADYIDYLLPIYQKKHTFLFDLNLELLQRVLQWWGINTPIELTSTYMVNTGSGILDLRSAISPKVTNEVAPTHAQMFPQYPQVFDARHGFLPNLGSLDLLFCKGPEGGIYLKETLANNLV